MQDETDFTVEEEANLNRYNVCIENTGITGRQPESASGKGGKKSHRKSSVAHKKSTGSHKSAVAKLFQASAKNVSKIPAKKSLKVVKVRSGRKA